MVENNKKEGRKKLHIYLQVQCKGNKLYSYTVIHCTFLGAIYLTSCMAVLFKQLLHEIQAHRRYNGNNKDNLAIGDIATNWGFRSSNLPFP